ncbi:hypothetical protein [Chitinophaga rhizophila]|uniref:YD repeat-containing protein n=1 Tax=Chitinophaga rhizophila TaxID=2866212 RepID=A0ABS7GIK0_9BACT|nr:hypothetical protein [Chitinophaga rhizophila]MBW8686975.1 hypothetical protein [Chitinophaga rhizophila]
MKTMVYIFLCVLFLGCTKHETPPSSPSAPKCRIISFTTGSWYDSSYVTYNSKGNPLSRIRKETGTGATNLFFRYDTQDRLSQMLTTYTTADNGEYFEEWHYYFYNNSGKIVKDSCWFNGTITANGPVPDFGQLFYGIKTFEYDNKGRIVNVVGWGQNNYRFTYDNRQNLDSMHVKTGFGSEYSVGYGPYDNTTNPNRTHKIWQFLSLDYSLNNASNVSATNQFGLPTAMSATREYPDFLKVFYTDLQITYDCNPTGSGHAIH